MTEQQSTIGALVPRLCPVCKKEKTIDDFHKDRRGRLGRSYACKECACQRAEAWRQKNLQRANARTRAWHRNNPEKVRANLIKHYAKGTWRDRWYRRRYGISETQVNNMILDQGGRCFICQTEKPGGRGQFSVDHNHDNGMVRKMLCQKCNTGLGSFRDNPTLLRLAADYLDSFK